ncbi:MAG TPA: DUF4139 domain-containing protein [Gemmataceae bacterium]|nr:DUF4139 domain-containing protein [Gemmataceae bacterium]
MGRKWFLACLGGGTLAALGIFIFLSPRPSTAEPNKPAPQDVALPQVTQLPIGQVVLFSSGVGYFQREGTVEGNARVDLSFPVTDINDLLKSMVLRDLDGGHISTVSYDSNAPIERTLKSFAVNLTTNPTFSQILNQARGEKVEVVLQQTNATQPGTLTGTLIGCEKQKQAVGGKDTVEVELLNMWCADGMRSLKMPEVQRVRFLNPILDSEFKKALETLALSHDTQKKSVSVNFVGEGKREVRVSYVVENPIWKTSYRLVLDKKTKKPFLQGWAVVENPTDEDWKDVRMALVSGRPISFQMDLYQPLYVTRPVVEMELFASLRPVAYSGGMKDEKAAVAGRAGAAFGFDGKPGASKGEGQGKDRALRESYRRVERDSVYADKSKQMLNGRMDLRAGVSSVASAAKLGDFFQYAIDKPVNLARQKSALLPIINKDVEGTRVSIYNERTQAKFPLLGLKFKNTSGLHLMQGPITVFEGSNYAGDARILDLQPNEERLISYAIDLGTEVNPVPSTDNGRLTQVKAVKGILHTTTKLRESKTYTIKNRNDQERLVLIEHPVRNEFTLVSTAKPAETASDFYRFQVKVAPGKTETQTVTEERLINSLVQLTNLDDNSIRHFISQTVTSDKVKAGLTKAMELRWTLEKTKREIAELQRQLDTIRTDQPRLRANLKELPQTSDAFKRIVTKFNEQETQIEKYQADIKKLQEVEHKQKKTFDDYLAGFNAE